MKECRRKTWSYLSGVGIKESARLTHRNRLVIHKVQLSHQGYARVKSELEGFGGSPLGQRLQYKHHLQLD